MKRQLQPNPELNRANSIHAYARFPSSGRLFQCGSRKRFWLLLLSLVFAAGTCGCQVLSYTSASGENFRRISLGTVTSISALDVESDTNGVRRVQLRGYQNDSAQALSAVTEAAVRAAVNSAPLGTAATAATPPLSAGPQP
jgi:hypothetical protein